jgi:acetyltransferase-like isoleucine patch superfamily enzyme
MCERNPSFPDAFVSADAEIGTAVEIGPGTVIRAGVRIGDHSRIGPYSVIGDAPVVIGRDVIIEGYCDIGHPAVVSDGTPLVIGDGSHIRSHSVFYEGSVFGEALVTGHRVTVRERTNAGNGFQLGTLSDVQGHCTIGNYVRTHSNVHICHAAVIEDFVWIYPFVVLTNDPHPPGDEFRQGPVIRRFAVIATHACIMPAVEVGEDSMVAAAALVTRDVPPRMVVGGVPARVLCPTEEIQLRDGSGRPAYPWRRHFHRGYPERTVREWKDEFPEG